METDDEMALRIRREIIEENGGQELSLTNSIHVLKFARRLRAELSKRGEPIAWMRVEDGIRIYYESNCWPDLIPLYPPPPQTEQAAHFENTGPLHVVCKCPACLEKEQAAPRQHLCCPSHCCPIHGCKYGYDDCPVATGKVRPEYPNNNSCESCEQSAPNAEGFTPADIRTLREANLALATESHRRAMLFIEWLETELDAQDEEYQPWMDDFTARVRNEIAPELGEARQEGAAQEVRQGEARPRVDSDLDAGWLPFPSKLHPDTRELVLQFAWRLAIKLRKAEKKYGYSNGWKESDWMDECRAKLREHVDKGDPLDVAAYCAFLMWHREPTASPSADAGIAKDAERYRWLRGNNEQHRDEELPNVSVHTTNSWGNWYDKFLSPEELDAAIDAALGGKGGGG